MPTFQDDPIISRMNVDNDRFSGGIYGESTKFNGVRGVSYAPGHGAVVGVSENHTNQAGPGVFGQSDGTGVWGTSKTWMGVYGLTQSTTGGAGVMGEHQANGTGVHGKSDTGVGVWGASRTSEGVHAETNSPVTAAIAGYNLNMASTGAAIHGEHIGNSIGILGKSKGGAGIWGVSQSHEGVHAETNSQGNAAIAAFNLNPDASGAAVFAHKEGTKGHAGVFEGRVWISGELGVGGDIILPNADCAEDFDVGQATLIDPGSVVVIGENGDLLESAEPYDVRVAGVISGAGAYRPGVVFDRNPSSSLRQPIALLGKVYCKADAQFGAIAVGDMLTTSATRGHAMKAADRDRSFGTVIGKALAPLREGVALIPVLVAPR